jgi:hypothetical protein
VVGSCEHDSVLSAYTKGGYVNFLSFLTVTYLEYELSFGILARVIWYTFTEV